MQAIEYTNSLGHGLQSITAVYMLIQPTLLHPFNGLFPGQPG